ncbi:MAG: 4'-phosphopantetheinyl transferase superfamily protein [Acidimicrobiia bacterium]|nr:4'-phosphopantetheinyl transferase superfamily protein [Acidimicrobiia bacterium]
MTVLDSLVTIEFVDLAGRNPRTAALLSDEERHRAARIHDDSLRARFETGRSELRRILGALLGIDPATVPISTGPWGKPFVPGAGIEFSYSRSGSVGVVATARNARIGVDIEAIDNTVDVARVARRVLAPDELDDFEASSDRRRTLLRFWTLKEALAKGCGTGFSVEPQDIRVTLDPRAISTPDGSRPDGWWLDHQMVARSYVLAVAVEMDGDPERGPPSIRHS